jgi:hypothetical protein
VYPLNELRDVRKSSDVELENCFEGDVVGQYAGQFNAILDIMQFGIATQVQPA